MGIRWWAAPVAVAAVATLAAACGSTSSPSSTSGSGGSTGGTSSSGSSSASGITTASTSKGTVLVNSKGRTLYWFAIDTTSSSKCTSAACVKFWPPVLGKPSMASGASISGTFGTIKRSNGQIQATYDGHPLYTFVSDTKSGDVNGNDINTSGGLWWAMTPSGAKLTAATSPKSSKSKGSGGGGYGY